MVESAQPRAALVTTMFKCLQLEPTNIHIEEKESKEQIVLKISEFNKRVCGIKMWSAKFTLRKLFENEISKITKVRTIEAKDGTIPLSKWASQMTHGSESLSRIDQWKLEWKLDLY